LSKPIFSLVRFSTKPVAQRVVFEKYLIRAYFVPTVRSGSFFKTRMDANEETRMDANEETRMDANEGAFIEDDHGFVEKL